MSTNSTMIMTNPCYRNDHHDMNSPLSGRPAGFRRNHSRNRTIVGYTNTVIIFRMHYVLHALCSCWTHACVNRKMMSGHDGVDDDIVFKSVDQLHRCDKYAGKIENRIHRECMHHAPQRISSRESCLLVLP